jgi:hypothetical protein
MYRGGGGGMGMPGVQEKIVMTRGMGLLVLAALLVAGNAAADSDVESKEAGNWFVRIEADRFGAGGRYVIANANPSGSGFGVRCIEKKLSLTFSELQSNFTVGEVLDVKVRVDKEPVVATAGVAMTERIVQIVPVPGLIRAIRDGRETAFRLAGKDGTSIVRVFDNTGAPEAFRAIEKECSLD